MALSEKQMAHLKNAVKADVDDWEHDDLVDWIVDDLDDDDILEWFPEDKIPEVIRFREELAREEKEN